MRLLFDTHIFIWAVSGDKRLKNSARTLIENADEVFVSAATIWEASIKAGTGKLNADIRLLATEIERSGFSELPVRASHPIELTTLPPLHGDPFDRILVAQAIVESLQLMTVDKQLARYPGRVLLV